MWPQYDLVKMLNDGTPIVTTCPVLTDDFRRTYYSRLTLSRHLENGIRRLDDVDYLTYLESLLVSSAHSEVQHGASRN